MTKKEYLQQAYRLNDRINSKIQQVDDLNALADKCTSTITGMPKNPGASASRMEDVVVKIVALEEAINEDIDRLVDLKAEIMAVIKAVKNPEYQTILEKRYLCYLSWEQIAVDLGYNVRHLYRLHSDALRAVSLPVKEVT